MTNIAYHGQVAGAIVGVEKKHYIEKQRNPQKTEEKIALPGPPAYVILPISVPPLKLFGVTVFRLQGMASKKGLYSWREVMKDKHRGPCRDETDPK